MYINPNNKKSSVFAVLSSTGVIARKTMAFCYKYEPLYYNILAWSHRLDDLVEDWEGCCSERAEAEIAFVTTSQAAEAIAASGAWEAAELYKLTELKPVEQKRKDARAKAARLESEMSKIEAELAQMQNLYDSCDALMRDIRAAGAGRAADADADADSDADAL